MNTDIKNFITGGIAVALTLSMTQVWSGLIQNASHKFSSWVICKNKKGSDYKSCTKNNLRSEFFAAIITTIFLIIISIVFVKFSGYKKS